MATKKSPAQSKAKPSAVSVPDEADPRFEPVIAALKRQAGFSLMESKSRALRGMMLHGKSIGMVSHGRFIVKLNEERVAELVTERVGKVFSMSPRRVSKGWLEVTSSQADWVGLAKEAVSLASAKPSKSRVKAAPATTKKAASKPAKKTARKTAKRGS